MLAQEVPLPGALGPSASLQPQALSSRHCFAAGQGSLLSSLARLQRSNEKARVVYGIYRGLYYTVRTIINHYKDLYETTSIMKSKRVFFVARLENRKPP